MEYSQDFADFQQAAAQTQEYSARRVTALQAVEPKSGQTVLEVGCGGGLFLCELAGAVGPTGKACGIDLSEQQLRAARANCGGLSNVEIQAGNALSLPYPNNTFDAVVSIQVLEYIDDLQGALREIHRVLKPGGRLVNFATLWHALFWNSRQPERMRQMLEAWDAHASSPNLPALLRALLLQSGFPEVQQSPFSMLNTSYEPDRFSYWLSRLLAAFVVQRQLVPQQVAEDWLQDLADMRDRNEYMFCSTAIISCAKRQRD